jgi:hypothetical protein
MKGTTGGSLLEAFSAGGLSISSHRIASDWFWRGIWRRRASGLSAAHVVAGLPMRTILGLTLLGLSWAIGMSMLMLALDDLLLGRLNLWFLWAGAVIASTLTVTAAEDIADWIARRRAALTGEFTMRDAGLMRQQFINDINRYQRATVE